MTPDVSVVVISFNDAGRLPRALASLQRQTLRALEIIVVDDASTDDTEAVVRNIADTDPRIRYERLPANSGGCSAPRNRGIDLATAPWIMFCDSDDEYERHACKNLLQAAERLDAEVVCGTAERVDARSGRTRRWRPDVHDDVRVADGLADFAELLYDTISVNKIYHRDLLERNGIRFPEGLLFEDQLFTLEAMASARRVAAIPEVVYRWYVDRLSDEPSITQRRNEARNVESRIEVNRRIDAYLSEHGLQRVQVVKDLKFLKHDLYLYLASMLDADDETALSLMARLRPYVAGVNLEPAWQVRPVLRVAIYHLLIGDLDGVRSAMRFVKWASVVDQPIVASRGREMWGCEHLGAGPAAAGFGADQWLDVTDLRILSIPFTQRRFLHRVDSVRFAGGELHVDGSTVDYDGSLGEVDGLELRLLTGAGGTAMTVPARWSGRDGTRWTWRASGPVRDGIGRRLDSRDRGTLALALRRGGLVNATSARATEESAPRIRVPFPGRPARAGVDAIELHPHDHGAVGWRAVTSSPVRSGLASIRHAWFTIPGARRAATVVSLVRRDWMPAVIHRLGGALPPKQLALFESDAGRTASGNARAISEALSQLHPRIEQAWVYRADPSRAPAFATSVERLSLRHHWLASRARLWVDDGTAPLTVRKPAQTVSVFAGGGVPVHRIGLDDPSVLVSKGDVRDVRRRSRRWGVALTPSAFASDVTARAFDYRGRVAEVGLMRADDAVRSRSDVAAIEALRQRLDLPTDRRIVLYAPASRRDDRDGTGSPIDLDEWAARLGARAYLLLRPPPSGSFTVPTALRFAIRDLGDTDDLMDFLAASDLFVSDYSWLIGDAALAALPVVLYQPDREMYVNRTRGVYAGLGDVGPAFDDLAGLIASVDEWLDDPGQWESRWSERRAAFAADRCGPPDGASADRAVDAFLGPMGASS